MGGHVGGGKGRHLTFQTFESSSTGGAWEMVSSWPDFDRSNSRMRLRNLTLRGSLALITQAPKHWQSRDGTLLVFEQ